MNVKISMKKNKLKAFAFGTMCLSLISCNRTDTMIETGHNLTEDNALYIGGRLITNDGATITQYLMLSDEEPESTELSSSLPSRSYFENLDRDSSLDEIIEQIGNCGYEGSGIIYHVWALDDGSKAKLVFNSKGKIEFIYIATEDSSERIFDRD